MKMNRLWGGLIALTVASACHAQPESKSPELRMGSALSVAHAQQSSLLGATRVGATRLLAVGDHGVIVLSDDEGKSWKQASEVPFDGLLAAVSFVDDRNGWAVGQGGVVLRSVDAGVNWTLQRKELDKDQPLLSVHFFDKLNGVAVGLWSLVLVTEDGGQTWTPQQLEAPPGARKADLNLYGLFAGKGGVVYAAAEKGMVLRSADGGRSWKYLSTGYAGSLWCGLVLEDGTLVVGGLRGSVYTSADDGTSWHRASGLGNGSISALATATTGSGAAVYAGSVGGEVLRSLDGGRTFSALQRARSGVSAIAPLAPNGLALFTRSGVAVTSRDPQLPK